MGTTPSSHQDRRTVVSWLLGGGVAASLASFFIAILAIRFLIRRIEAKP